MTVKVSNGSHWEDNSTQLHHQGEFLIKKCQCTITCDGASHFVRLAQMPTN